MDIIITIATVLLLTITSPDGARLSLEKPFASPSICADALTAEFVAATDANLWVSGGCFVTGQEA